MSRLESLVDDAKKKIDLLRKEDSLVFILFTDWHTIDIHHEYTKRLIEVLSLITKRIDYDSVINLGDNFGMLGRSIQISNEELEQRFKELFDAVFQTTGHRVINVNGNHDGIGTDFFKPQFWNEIAKGKYGNEDACYGEEGCYHYIDYEKTNTRIVVLSIPVDSDLESDMPSPHWCFGEKQLNWLRNTALATEKDVLILSHSPFFYKYDQDMDEKINVWTGEETKMSYVSSLCGWIDDIDEAVEVINEFKMKGKGKLLACLSGHMHEDSFWLKNEKKGAQENPLPCVQVVTARACTNKRDEDDVGLCIDIVLWTPSLSQFNLVRIGNGQDRMIKL